MLIGVAYYKYLKQAYSDRKEHYLKVSSASGYAVCIKSAIGQRTQLSQRVVESVDGVNLAIE